MHNNNDSAMTPAMSPGTPQANMQQYRIVYPELYYRLQPYIMSACDELDSYETMPSQDMIERMSDCIYEDISGMYPDYADYIRDNDEGRYNARPTINPLVTVPRFRPRSRRRGLFRDFIDILLLSEMTRRRRNRYGYNY